MEINKSEKHALLEKLNQLLKRQSQFQQEINELQRQIISLNVSELKSEEISESTLKKQTQQKSSAELITRKTYFEQLNHQAKKPEKERTKTGINVEIEKFIGENLINKIGIAVLIIGVGIGAKYAIDNNLISPLVRIILGYLVGGTLALFALRLKKRYINFSAVLFSGAMAIFYFISYAAYTYYSLFPYVIAFILMVLFTVATVMLALYYDRQVIAHFGLAGAYIVPFILYSPVSSAVVLFTYMLIINLGILFISTKKQWKPLNYIAFVATWAIFFSWFASKNYNNQLGIALIYGSMFFVIFYLVFLSYKLILKEKFRIDDISFLLLNSAIIYIVGYVAIDAQENTKEYLGLFTMINAFLHGITCYLIYKSKPQDKKLFYWTIGIVIAFLTITIPVQFNGYYTAIIWSIGTALLFLYAKSKKINVYENIASGLIFLTAIATLTIWNTTSYNLYGNEIEKLYSPVFNMEFLSSFIVILSFIFIFYINRKSNLAQKEKLAKTNLFEVAFPLLTLFIIYFTFFTQISLYWNNVQVHTSFELYTDGIWEKQFKLLNQDISRFMSLWLINYTLLYVSLLSFVNFKWFKNKNFDAFILVINFFMILLFLTVGFNNLSELRESYLSTNLPSNYDVSIYHILIRYISLAFFTLILYANYRFVVARLNTEIINKIFEVTLCISIIWTTSSELINWLELGGSTEVYKHGLSILWGVLSLIFIIYGIWKKKNHIRFSAIILLGITLLKLFFYDLTNLKTIPKTIVCISIGILFLIISFLYNKYKKLIFPENINHLS